MAKQGTKPEIMGMSGGLVAPSDTPRGVENETGTYDSRYVPQGLRPLVRPFVFFRTFGFYLSAITLPVLLRNVCFGLAGKCVCGVRSGKCMGTAFRNVRPPAGLGLYPIVVLPSVAHEAVRLARCADGDSASFPAPVG